MLHFLSVNSPVLHKVKNTSDLRLIRQCFEGMRVRHFVIQHASVCLCHTACAFYISNIRLLIEFQISQTIIWSFHSIVVNANHVLNLLIKCVLYVHNYFHATVI